jgi:hypothetical protein
MLVELYNYNLRKRIIKAIILIIVIIFCYYLFFVLFRTNTVTDYGVESVEELDQTRP